MAATSPGVGLPRAVVLSTALQLVTPAAGVRYVYVSCTAVVNLVYSDSLTDGGVLPTHFFAIPANTLFPIAVVGPQIFVAAASGTPTVYLLGAL